MCLQAGQMQRWDLGAAWGAPSPLLKTIPMTKGTTEIMPGWPGPSRYFRASESFRISFFLKTHLFGCSSHFKRGPVPCLTWGRTMCYSCCCLVSQSCLTLCDLMDCSSPGFSVLGILQARTLCYSNLANCPKHTSSFLFSESCVWSTPQFCCRRCMTLQPPMTYSCTKPITAFDLDKPPEGG